MIGYYIHHVGKGHVHRARAIAAHLRDTVTGLSSLPRPDDWQGPWVTLPRDDDGGDAVLRDPTAGSVLHWVPLHHPGLQHRMAAIADWIARERPRVMVVDVSVEVTTLTRLCGVPVVSVVLPGERDDDAHQLAFRLSDALLAPWPLLDRGMCGGLAPHRHKVCHVGGLSRFDGRASERRAVERHASSQGVHVLALGGLGGDAQAHVRPRLPAHWSVTHRGHGNWVEDLWPELIDADVVVTHAGLGAISDVAAARRPVIVIAEPRPYDEQVCTAAAMRRAGLGVVLDDHPSPEQWRAVIARARRRDSCDWATRWSDGTAAARSAAVIARVAADRSP